MEGLFFSVLVGLVEVLLLRGFALVDLSTPLVLEAAKGFEALAGVVVLRGFVALEGLVGTGGLLFAGPLLAALAHILPQTGYTVSPSLYLGLFPHCLGTQTIQELPDPTRNVHAATHSTQQKTSRQARCSTSVAKWIILSCGRIPRLGLEVAILRRGENET